MHNKIRPECIVNHRKKKIEILKIEQHAQIKAYCQNQKSFPGQEQPPRPPGLLFLPRQQSVKQIIADNAAYHDQQIREFKVTVKPK